GTSQFLDAYGYNLIALNATGPILYGKKTNPETGELLRDSLGNTIVDKNKAKLGFIVAGEATFNKDADPAYGGIYRVKDNVLSDLEQNPLQPGEGSQFFFVNRANFVRKSDMETIKAKENASQWNASFFGRLDYRLNDNTTINVGTSYRRFQGYGWSLGNSLFSPQANGFQTTDNYRVFGRIQQIYMPKDANKTILKSLVYRVQGEAQRVNSNSFNPDFGDDLFKYGHIGSFYNQRAEAFETILPGDARHNPVFSTGPYLQTAGYQDTVWSFDGSNSSNPLLANYNNFIYNYMARNPRNFNGALFPGGDLMGQRTSVYNYFDLAQLGGLNNGSGPAAIYSMYTAPGAYNWGYSYSQSDMVRITGQATMRLARKSMEKKKEEGDLGEKNSEKGYHNVKVGFEFDQRFERSYGVSPSGIWGQMQLLANRHLQNLDTANAQAIYDADGFFTGRVHLDPLPVLSEQSTFDRNMRIKLGLDPNGRDFINPQQYGPDFYSMDMFGVSELFNSSLQLVAYNGYDYLGNKMKRRPAEDFFTDLQNRPINAYAPTYVAAYVEDRFELDNLNLRLGLRVDRFDNNQPVLRDKYLMVPAYNAGDMANLGNIELPSNIGRDWVPYLNRQIQDGEIITSINDVIGYRDPSNNLWYDANGSPVNPQLLQVSGRVQPYTKSDSIQPAAFKDYDPRVNVMPRIAFSFPITDKANFTASYDVLTQRPTAANVANYSQYMFIQNRVTGAISNPDLGAQTTIDYQVGFSQSLDEFGLTAFTINAYYREMRDMIQIVRNINAYPITYDSYENVDFGTVKGLSFSFTTARLGQFSIRANYTLQYATGTGSGVGSSTRALNNITGFALLRNTLPLSFDQRHTFNGAVQMTFDERKYIGPKIGNFYPLKRTIFSLTYNIGSGTPYTRNTLPNPADIQGGLNEVFQTKGQPFGSKLPMIFNVNFRIQKSVSLVLNPNPKDGYKKRTLDMDWYIVFSNMLNIKNVLGVYAYSGQPDNSGYLESAFGPRLINSQLDPEAFVDMYRIREQNPGNFGSPRQIRLGCIFNF
ncbi:MAG: TonB-dependent receptor, partial [Bacteroidetes bacterium]|nr:TonB-dependent receptor [Bacteroidota bacterium]